MYIDSYYEIREKIMNDQIEREMYNTKKEAVTKISSVVTHFSQQFSTILSYAWFDSLPDAEKIADQLDLCKLDFLALREDFSAFKEEYLKYYDEAQNF